MRPLDVRPLDPVRSIKAKLGLLVVATVMVTAVLLWYGLRVLNWRSRYTLPVVVVVAVGVTQVLAHGMTSPLRQMTAAARAMAQGRPPPPVSTTSRDEVGDLARAFTAMAAEIATADVQRRELLANVAHELRTPVAALRAQLENLLDGVRAADPVALTEALDQTERLGALVDDLLDLARAQAGPAGLDRRAVPLAALVRAVAREVDDAQRDRGTAGPEILVDVPEGLVASADPARLRQVLVNLLDNAVRHGDRLVRVEARPDDGHGGVLLEVVDDGPGIAQDERDAVFERFRRGQAPAVRDGRRDGGTGLGLAIARWAVELHGGRIAVQPASQGCVIRVQLPGPLDPATRRDPTADHDPEGIR